MWKCKRLKEKIRTLERNNRRDFRDLGRMVYERYKNGEVQEGNFSICVKIFPKEKMKYNHVKPK